MAGYGEYVRVPAEDADAFRGVIACRAAFVSGGGAFAFDWFHDPAEQLCERGMNYALDALLVLRGAEPDRDKAIRLLERAAAMAITTINTLREES